MGLYGEHVLPRSVNVACGLKGVEPLRRRVDLLTAAGFTITGLDVFYEEGTPKVLGADSLGAAVSP
jgi:hypothetical protein